MTPDKDVAHDVSANLAFVRALVSEGGRAQMSGGLLFFVGGVIFGLQCFGQWAAMVGLVAFGYVGNYVVALVPMAIMVAVIAWVWWQGRKSEPKGVATRAVNAAFIGAGLANIFMVFFFGYNARSHHDVHIWLYYPAVVSALQGAAWCVAYQIRRQLWLAGVSAGWFLTTFALTFQIDSPTYVLILALALFFLMGGSGLIMMRMAKSQG